MKYLITGNAGSGKSTIIAELQKRGFTAYDTDFAPGLTQLIPNHGEGLPFKSVWDEQVLKALINSKQVVFIAGSVTNQQEFYPLFDEIFALIIDEDTLTQRLTTRKNNDTGKNPKDLAFLTSIHQRIQNNLQTSGAHAIDATAPIAKVVDAILAQVKAPINKPVSNE